MDASIKNMLAATFHQKLLIYNSNGTLCAAITFASLFASSLRKEQQEEEEECCARKNWKNEKNELCNRANMDLQLAIKKLLEFSE